MRKSLEEIRTFWQERGVWPETEPIDPYEPAVIEPDELIYMDRGGDPIRNHERLKTAYVEEYVERGTWAFASESPKKFAEHREGLAPAD